MYTFIEAHNPIKHCFHNELLRPIQTSLDLPCDIIIVTMGDSLIIYSYEMSKLKGRLYLTLVSMHISRMGLQKKSLEIYRNRLVSYYYMEYQGGQRKLMKACGHTVYKRPMMMYV